jgi:NADH:ubiquinone oxidoreductase subunit 2 (subunit N)
MPVSNHSLLQDEQRKLIRSSISVIFIYKQHPTLAFAITLAMFSLAGIPPLAGFIANTW